jgi:hypothetical protein
VRNFTRDIFNELTQARLSRLEKAKPKPVERSEQWCVFCYKRFYATTPVRVSIVEHIADNCSQQRIVETVDGEPLLARVVHDMSECPVRRKHIVDAEQLA